MKNRYLASILFSASLVLALPAATQASSQPARNTSAAASHRIQVTIPFEFRAEGSVLPAGTYLFTFDANSQSGSIQGIGRPIKILTFTDYVPSNSKPKLQFKRDGQLMVLQAAGAGDSPVVNRSTGPAETQNRAATAGR